MNFKIDTRYKRAPEGYHKRWKVVGNDERLLQTSAKRFYN